MLVQAHVYFTVKYLYMLFLFSYFLLFFFFLRRSVCRTHAHLVMYARTNIIHHYLHRRSFDKMIMSGHEAVNPVDYSKNSMNIMSSPQHVNQGFRPHVKLNDHNPYTNCSGRSSSTGSIVRILECQHFLHLPSIRLSGFILKAFLRDGIVIVTLFSSFRSCRIKTRTIMATGEMHHHRMHRRHRHYP